MRSGSGINSVTLRASLNDTAPRFEKRIEKPGNSDKAFSMSIHQLKEEIKELGPVELDQVAALILQLRRSNNPERKKELAEMIDDPNTVVWKQSADSE